MKLFKISVIMLCMPSILIAGPVSQEDVMHIAAHAGATYVGTHMTEVICTKIVGKEHKLACTLTGIVLANGLNVAYKANQGFPNDTKRAVYSGLGGSGLAGLMITIDF